MSMTMALKQPQFTRLERAPWMTPRTQTHEIPAWLAGLFGFCCLMPYPAISAGNNSAIQLGNIVTIVILLTAALRVWRDSRYVLGPLVLVPLCVSMFKITLWDDVDASLAMKTLISWAVTVITVMAAQFAAPRRPVAILVGVAIAMVVHSAVGAWQFISFQSGVFPFPDLYNNPSFLSVQENAMTIARWTRRPFGLFPEPSAMSSSLAPFVVLFTAILLNLLHLRQPLQPWHRRLFFVATSGSVVLMIVSQSGHAVPTLAILLVLLLVWLKNASATMGTFVKILALCAIAGIGAFFAFDAMNTRITGAGQMGNDSWGERSTSMVIGLQNWCDHDIVTALFGVGPGVSSLLIEQASGIKAVFSIVLSYVYETGFFGLFVLASIGRGIFLTWKRSDRDITYLGITIIWLIGITVTTSYSQLLSIWLTLGWLNVWPQIVAAKVVKAVPQVTIRRREVRALPAPRRNTWTEAALAGAGSA